MSSLIEGWFQPTNGRPFTDNPPDTTTGSPRKSKSYLSVYDSCASLGPISSGIFIDCELRLFPGNQAISSERVIHVHGWLSVVPATDEDDPRLQVEVHHFVVTNMIDPAGKDTPDDLRTSVTLSGRVAPLSEMIGNTTDKFFMLELSDYIRDHMQTFTIRFASPPSPLCYFLTIAQVPAQQNFQQALGEHDWTSARLNRANQRISRR